MGNSLSDEGFVEVPRAHSPGGVVALLWKGEVVFVGRSWNVYSRVAIARAAMLQPSARAGLYVSDGQMRAKAIRFDEFWVKFCEPGEAMRLEVKYREMFRPRLNGPIPAAPRISMVDLAERAKVVL